MIKVVIITSDGAALFSFQTGKVYFTFKCGYLNCIIQLTNKTNKNKQTNKQTNKTNKTFDQTHHKLMQKNTKI